MKNQVLGTRCQVRAAIGHTCDCVYIHTYVHTSPGSARGSPCVPVGPGAWTKCCVRIEAAPSESESTYKLYPEGFCSAGTNECLVSPFSHCPSSIMSPIGCPLPITCCVMLIDGLQKASMGILSTWSLGPDEIGPPVTLEPILSLESVKLSL